MGRFRQRCLAVARRRGRQVKMCCPSEMIVFGLAADILCRLTNCPTCFASKEADAAMAEITEPIVGIDLGTTNSEIAAYVDGKPQISATARGSCFPRAWG